MLRKLLRGAQGRSTLYSFIRRDIAINSLGFSGAMLVRTAQDLQILKDVGPMYALEQLTYKSERNNN